MDAQIAGAPLTFPPVCTVVVQPNSKLVSNIFFLLNSTHPFSTVRHSSSLPCLIALLCLAVFHGKSHMVTLTKILPTLQGLGED